MEALSISKKLHAVTGAITPGSGYKTRVLAKRKITFLDGEEGDSSLSKVIPSKI